MANKWLITTPNKQYKGITEGVQFEEGKAIVEDKNMVRLLTDDYGYHAEAVEEEAKKDEPKQEKKAPKKSIKSEE